MLHVMGGRQSTSSRRAFLCDLWTLGIGKGAGLYRFAS